MRVSRCTRARRALIKFAFAARGRVLAAPADVSSRMIFTPDESSGIDERGGKNRSPSWRFPTSLSFSSPLVAETLLPRARPNAGEEELSLSFTQGPGIPEASRR